MTNNHLQNVTQEAKDPVALTPLKTQGLNSGDPEG